MRSRAPVPAARCHSRSGMPRREARSVTGSERIGPYTLVRGGRGGLDPGGPRQVFMLSPPRPLPPRPMSLCLAPPGELAFLIDPIGPGTRALAALAPGDRLTVFGPLGNGFRLPPPPAPVLGGGGGVGGVPRRRRPPPRPA